MAIWLRLELRTLILVQNTYHADISAAYIFSSPEPKADKVSLKDGHALGSVRRRHPASTISKIASETTWPVRVKLHVEHP